MADAKRSYAAQYIYTQCAERHKKAATLRRLHKETQDRARANCIKCVYMCFWAYAVLQVSEPARSERSICAAVKPRPNIQYHYYLIVYFFLHKFFFVFRRCVENVSHCARYISMYIREWNVFAYKIDVVGRLCGCWEVFKMCVCGEGLRVREMLWILQRYMERSTVLGNIKTDGINVM